MTAKCQIGSSVPKYCVQVQHSSAQALWFNCFCALNLQSLSLGRRFHQEIGVHRLSRGMELSPQCEALRIHGTKQLPHARLDTSVPRQNLWACKGPRFGDRCPRTNPKTLYSKQDSTTVTMQKGFTRNKKAKTQLYIIQLTTQCHCKEKTAQVKDTACIQAKMPTPKGTEASLKTLIQRTSVARNALFCFETRIRTQRCRDWLRQLAEPCQGVEAKNLPPLLNESHNSCTSALLHNTNKKFHCLERVQNYERLANFAQQKMPETFHKHAVAKSDILYGNSLTETLPCFPQIKHIRFTFTK